MIAAPARKRPWHQADRWRVEYPVPGSWWLSFDGSTAWNGTEAIGTWAAVVVLSSGAVAYRMNGGACSYPLSNVCCEWEGLARGLELLCDLQGFPALQITGDEQTVIGQLNGDRRCKDELCCRWLDLSLTTLARISRPWTARKVGRDENQAAHALAGGW